MTLKKKLLLFLVIGLLCGFIFPRYVQRAVKRHYCDFRVYYHTAQVFVARGDVYFRDKEEITPFKYSPTFAFFFSPLAVVPIKVAAVIFLACNLLMTGFLFWLIPKAFSYGARSRWERILLYGVPALILSRFVLQTWDTGQVHILMCFLTVLALYAFSRSREKTGAAFLAGAILVKYMPALFIGYFFVQRRWTRILWVLVFIGGLLALPAVSVGLAKAWAYLAVWMPSIISTSLDPFSYIDYKNQSFYSMVIRFFSDTSYHVNFLHLTFRQAQLLGYALAAGLYSLVLFPGRGARQEKLDWAMMFVLVPLFNPNGWMGNFVFLIVPIMAIVDRLLQVRGRDRFVMGCLIVAFILLSVPAQDIVGNDLENLAESFSCVTFGALALGLALVKLKFFGEKSVGKVV